MRQIERRVCGAFLANRYAKSGNTASEYPHLTGGKHGLYLHGNRIAEWRGERIYISTGGWDTVTTRSRLKAIGANVAHVKGQLYLNGGPWDGSWQPIDKSGCELEMTYLAHNGMFNGQLAVDLKRVDGLRELVLAIQSGDYAAAAALLDLAEERSIDLGKWGQKLRAAFNTWADGQTTPATAKRFSRT